MGMIPKEDENLKKEVEETVVEAEETKSVEEINEELNDSIAEAGKEDIPEEEGIYQDDLLNTLQKERELENALLNITLIDLKIEVVERELALENYKGEDKSKEVCESLRGEVASLRELRRTVIKETDLALLK